MGVYAKSIWKTLRRLKKSCTVVHDIMKALMNLPYMDAVSCVLFWIGCKMVINPKYTLNYILKVKHTLISFRQSYGPVLKVLSWI